MLKTIKESVINSVVILGYKKKKRRIYGMYHVSARQMIPDSSTYSNIYIKDLLIHLNNRYSLIFQKKKMEYNNRFF